MKVWKLVPQGDIKHKGYVRIRAKSEMRAREIAMELFEKYKSEEIQPTEWSGLRWKDPNAVQCIFEDDDNIATQEGVLDIQ